MKLLVRSSESTGKFVLRELKEFDGKGYAICWDEDHESTMAWGQWRYDTSPVEIDMVPVLGGMPPGIDGNQLVMVTGDNDQLMLMTAKYVPWHVIKCWRAVDVETTRS